MNTSESFLRLAWKEYRVQRPLWLAVLTLTPVVQGVVAGIAGIRIFNDSPMTADGFMVMGLAALAVYWLGCGATLFATEHEAGTFDFQRTMPVTAWQVFGAKLAVALGSGALLGAILWMFTQLTFAQFQARAIDLWIPTVLTAVEVLAWSTFFSLILRQPLWAAVAGVVVPSAIVGIALPLLRPIPLDFNLFMYHRSYVLERSILALCVLGVNVALARPWFDGRLRWPGLSDWRRWFRWTEPEYAVAIEMDRPLAAFTGRGRATTRRMIWMSWRQGRWILLSLAAVFVLTAWGVGTLTPAEREVEWTRLFVPTIVASLAFGLCTFLFEQWRSEYRFWAERGISTRRLWAVRQMFWLAPLSAMVGVTLLSSRFAPDMVLRLNPASHHFLLISCVLIPTGLFAIGQFSAMFVPRTIIAVVTTCFASFLYYVWFALMLIGDVPLSWSVVPIPAVLLALTAWYAPHWAEDRLDRRAARRITACLVVPGLLVGGAATAHRAWQIPETDPGFSPAELTRPLNAQELETARNYWQACAKIARWASVPPEQDREEVLAQLRKAHSLPSAPLIAPGASPFMPDMQYLGATMSANPLEFQPSTCVAFLRGEARRAIEAGQLDEAGESFEIALELLRRAQLRMHVMATRPLIHQQDQVLEDVVAWSHHREQTSARVLKMLRWLESFERRQPDDVVSIQHEYLAIRTLYGGANAGTYYHQLLDEKTVSETRFIRDWMPWEAERSRRLLDLVVKYELRAYAEWLERLKQGGGPIGWPQSHLTEATLVRWQSNTMFPMFSHSIQAAQTSIARVAMIRSARLRIALRDYHREHGAWPDTLDQLAATYFGEESLPSDPAGGKPVYFVRGVPFDISVGVRIKVPAHAPFLWWPGQSGVIHQETGDGVGQFTRYGNSTIPPATALQMGLVERLE